MGGASAFEIAQQLTSLEEQVALLMLIETWPPVAATVPRHPPGFLRTPIFLVEGILRHLRAVPIFAPRRLLQFARVKAAILMDVVRTRDVYRGDKSALFHALVEEANARAFLNYLPKPYGGSVVLCVAEGRMPKIASDPRLTWGSLSAGGYQVFQVPGADSGSLLREPNVRVIAELLRERLAPSPAPLLKENHPKRALADGTAS